MRRLKLLRKSLNIYARDGFEGLVKSTHGKLLSTFLKLAWKFGNRKRKKASRGAILLTGSPRSGTTWLLEIIERAPKVTRGAWEPFRWWSIPTSDDHHRGVRTVNQMEELFGIELYSRCLTPNSEQLAKYSN